MIIRKERIVQELYAIPMRCHRCRHFWNYKGNNTFSASCPNCRTKVSINKHSFKNISGTGSQLSHLDQSSEIHNHGGDESIETNEV